MSCHSKKIGFVGAVLALASLKAPAAITPPTADGNGLQARLTRLSEAVDARKAALREQGSAQAAEQLALWGDFSDGIFRGDFGDSGFGGAGGFSDGVFGGDFADANVGGVGGFSDGVFRGDFSDADWSGFTDFSDGPLWSDWGDW